MGAGWFDAKCKTWAGSRTGQCQECYQQARALQLQCEGQRYEDTRFDEQQAFLVELVQEWGKWILLGVGVLLLLYWLLSE